MKTNRIWLIGWLVMVISALAVLFYWVHRVDPYFHYHKPLTDTYFYPLDNERSQNDGITRTFDYDTIITGTSMAQNFKTSEADEVFGAKSIKICYSGATLKEINEALERALEYNKDIKRVIRSLDMTKFRLAADEMRSDLGAFPEYLYDDNPFNDVNYIFNKDVIFKRVYKLATENDEQGFKPGITSFDKYGRWQESATFGINTVAKNGVKSKPKAPEYMTEEERATLEENIRVNLTDLVEKYPDVEFYCFMTPYSALWWNGLANNGTLYKQLEAERYVVEQLVQYDNVKLFSINTRQDIITNINNYKDTTHYGEWINSLMLKWMKNGEYQLTRDNFEEYLAEEYDFVTNYDYASLNGQEDYEYDLYAAALLHSERTGIQPKDIFEQADKYELKSAELVDDQYEGEQGIRCVGRLNKETGTDLAEYISASGEYIGAKFTVNTDGYDYLVFYGKKEQNHGQPSIIVYDADGKAKATLSKVYKNIDNEWNRYVLDLRKVSGDVTIIFNGGYRDKTGSESSAFVFSDITLY